MSETALRVRWGMVIHGGVGVLPSAELTADLEKAYREVLGASLKAGYAAMKGGGTSVDGVVEAIQVMEDSPLFNAGRGSNFTTDGTVSMDASIMMGDSLEAGAVSGVRDVRYPIRLARHVMEDCPHVMLSGEGAELFAREAGMVPEDPEFFFTQRRWDDLQAAKEREAAGQARPNTVDVEDALAMAAGAQPPEEVSSPPSDATGAEEGGPPGPEEDEEGTRFRSGTVGAVALDMNGRLVAGTSTGGSANKKWGRIGDSPVIGAGTYAGSLCAVSCTGWGEYFIRHAVAHDIQARMAYSDLSLKEAAHQVIMKDLESVRRGLGGIVAMDRDGHVEMCFNTHGMYRGWVDQDGRLEVDIF